MAVQKNGKELRVISNNADPKRSYVEADCKCAMTNMVEGFCSSVIGTEFYRKAMLAKKLLLTRSNCHTLDRDNIRAQKDKCGIGMITEEFRYAVDQKFNVTHWPYIHNITNYVCVSSFFKDSYDNLSLKNAVPLFVQNFAQSLAVPVFLVLAFY